jgi:hypothetical protein
MLNVGEQLKTGSRADWVRGWVLAAKTGPSSPKRRRRRKSAKKYSKHGQLRVQRRRQLKKPHFRRLQLQQPREATTTGVRAVRAALMTVALIAAGVPVVATIEAAIHVAGDIFLMHAIYSILL